MEKKTYTQLSFYFDDTEDSNNPVEIVRHKSGKYKCFPKEKKSASLWEMQGINIYEIDAYLAKLVHKDSDVFEIVKDEEGQDAYWIKNEYLTNDRNAIYQLVKDSRKITEFQRKVYLALLDVPRGETITYGELARRIGCGSAQAIGQALRRNPFAPAVPCHRVVAKNGIGGFYGQREGEMIEKKKQMLIEESEI